MSPQIPMLKPSPPCNGIRRWGFGVFRARGWSPHDGITVLIKEAAEILLLLPALPPTLGLEENVA